MYISFINKLGKWGERIKLGDKINTEGAERDPGVTMNGKIFFFARDSQIMWYTPLLLKKYEVNWIRN